MARLTGRAAIVTGSAQGIGAAYAKALAAEGAKVSLCDVKPTDAVVREIKASGGAAIGRICDITKPAELAALVRATEEAFGGVQILMNNAALFANITLKPFWEISSEEWDQVMTVNVRGSFECVKAVLPVMRKQNYGKIINIASGTFFKGTPMMVHYVSSKGAVVGMTRTMARELGQFGIRVNCIAPGLTLSEAVAGRTDYGAMREANVQTRALKREEQPEDLTGAAVFLASAESDFMTGQTMLIDGGSAMH